MSRIMIVDDNVINLTLAKKVLEKSYTVVPVPSGAMALKVLGKLSELPDLILLDVNMPDVDGFQLAKTLKSDGNLAEIPIIFLTAANEVETEVDGLSIGAVDYIVKPIHPELLKKRVEIHLTMLSQKKELAGYANNLQSLVDEKTQNILQLQFAIIHTVSDLIQKRDGYTGGHTIRVSQYVEILLDALFNANKAEGIEVEDIPAIVLSSKLHDVGKIAIPDHILLKPGKLTSDEFDSIKTHTNQGADSIIKSMLSPQELEAMPAHTLFGADSISEAIRFAHDNIFLKHALTMARSHHEKWSGEGYPDGLAGEDIPFMARVLAIADVYDALRSHRPYKGEISHEMSVKLIEKDSGYSFDPSLVEVFLTVEKQFEMLAKGFY